MVGASRHGGSNPSLPAISFCCLAFVAQSVELSVVIRAGVGSSPIDRPNFIQVSGCVAQLEELSVLTRRRAGSIPATPTTFQFQALLAELVDAPGREPGEVIRAGSRPAEGTRRGVTMQTGTLEAVVAAVTVARKEQIRSVVALKARLRKAGFDQAAIRAALILWAQQIQK